MKRPSFQFYPDAWLSCPELRRCSSLAKAIWIDLLCLMHGGEPYGNLRTGNAPFSTAEIARVTGESPRRVKAALDELVRNGVPGVHPDGVLYSRKMVADEKVRAARAAGGELGAEHGVKGGRPSNGRGSIETPSRGTERGFAGNPPSSPASSPAPAPELPAGARDAPARAPEASLGPEPDGRESERWDAALAERPGLASPAVVAALTAWRQHRDALGLAWFTRASLAAFLDELAGWGPERAVVAIRYSLTKNAKSVFEPEEHERARMPVASTPKPLTPVQEADFLAFDALNRERNELRKTLGLTHTPRVRPDVSTLTLTLESMRAEVANLRTNYGRNPAVAG